MAVQAKRQKKIAPPTKIHGAPQRNHTNNQRPKRTANTYLTAKK